MITYTEKERRWILSDPGEISLRTGKLEPSITSSMFIESPSSLELMLGRQKQPSWDCKDQKHNVLHSRKHPDQSRKRKASWSGEFEDQERSQKSNSLQREPDSVKNVGYSSMSKKIRNLHVQYEDRRQVMVETLQMQRSTFTEYRRGTNGFHPSNKLKTSFGDADIGNNAQHFGRQTKAMTKVPKSRTSLSNSRLMMKKKNLKENESEEIMEAPNLADLMSKVNGVEKKKLTTKGNTHYLPATILANKTNNGVVLALPRVGGCLGQDNVTRGNQGRKDLQVGTSSTKWRKANTPLSTGPSEKRKRRIKIVGRHALDGECLVNSVTGSREKDIVSQKVHHVEKFKKDLRVLEGECLVNSVTGSREKDIVSQKVHHVEKFKKDLRVLEGECLVNSVTGSREKDIVSQEVHHVEKFKKDLRVLEGECLVNSVTGSREKDIVSQEVHHVEKFKKDLRVLGDECLASSSTGLRKNEVVSQRVNHSDKPSQKRRQSQLLNGNVTPHETWERRKGSSKKVNFQGLQIPGLVHTANQSKSDNGYTRRSPTDGHLECNEVVHFGPQGCALPSNRDDVHISIPDEVLPNNHIHDLENAHPEADVRLRVKELLENFREIHNSFTGGHKDKEAFQIMVGFFPELLVNGTESIYGEVPGVEPGDRFHYRAEMDLVGLHHKPRKGIDFIPASKSRWPYGGKPVSIAACVVVAGGYVDNRDEGDVIIYTGEGGNNAIYDKGPSKDQMLTSGNEALRHSLLLHLYVRVVRKIDLKPPIKPYYRYDGLYAVKDLKKERSRGQKGKALRFGEDGEKLKSSKCNKMPSSTLVYKFLLIRKSKEEKYENANFENLWTFKPSSCPRALNGDQEVNLSSSGNVPNSSQQLQDF